MVKPRRALCGCLVTMIVWEREDPCLLFLALEFNLNSALGLSLTRSPPQQFHCKKKGRKGTGVVQEFNNQQIHENCQKFLRNRYTGIFYIDHGNGVGRCSNVRPQDRYVCPEKWKWMMHSHAPRATTKVFVMASCGKQRV